MKHRESEQTQLRVSRLLNRDSVMLHAEMPSVQTGNLGGTSGEQRRDHQRYRLL